jgi:hypothetical protein
MVSRHLHLFSAFGNCGFVYGVDAPADGTKKAVHASPRDFA